MTALDDKPCNTGPLRQGVLLVNTGSRKGQEWFEEARRTLLSNGVRLSASLSFKSVDRLVEAARWSVRQSEPVIMVGGGDGTINAVAGIVAKSSSVLGVLPFGTGNAFARDLGIPATVAGACEVIRNGNVVEVDVGRIQDRYFVNVATIGLTTEIARQLTDPMKKTLGRLAYAVAIARALKKLKPFHARLTTENGTSEFECLQLVIGNGHLHGGPFPVLPDASLTAGKFSIYALTGSRRSELIKYALLLPGGNHTKLREVHTEHAFGGTLTTMPSLKVTVDGEVALRTPVQFEAIPRALRVLAASPELP